MIGQDVMELSDYGAIFRRRKVQLIVPFVIILLISITVAYSLPPVYRSTATILIERQEVPSDLVETTVTGYINERLQIISKRVMTHERLWAIAEKFDLYPEERSLENAEVIAARMRENTARETINVETANSRGGDTVTVAFTISFYGNTPEVAKKVTDELATLYLEENRNTRIDQAAGVSKFFEEEADRIGEQISEYERKLATFKQQNVGQLPELAQINRQLFENTQQQLMGAEDRIQTLEERRINLQAQIVQTPQTVPSYNERGERVPTLNEQRVRLAELRQRYSEEHPDVKALKNNIAALESAGNASGAASSLASNNPVYVTLKAQLENINAELQAEKARQAQLRQRLATFEERLFETPEVERDYLALSRDYQSAVAKYSEMRRKQMEARLAEQLEAEQKGERFSLLEPASMPLTPAKPNRLGIVFLGGVLSLGGGVGWAAIAEYMDRTVRGIKQVAALFQMPPIAVIPYIENQDDIRHKWRNGIIVSLLTMGVIGLALYMLHLQWMPLDELWASMNGSVDADTETHVTHTQ